MDQHEQRTDGSAIPAEPSRATAVSAAHSGSVRPDTATPADTDASVSAALNELATVGELPLAQHPDAFGRVHTSLQQALSGVDDA